MKRPRWLIGLALVGGAALLFTLVVVTRHRGAATLVAPISSTTSVSAPSSAPPPTTVTASTVLATTLPAVTVPEVKVAIAAPDVPLPTLTVDAAHVVGSGVSREDGQLLAPQYQMNAGGVMVVEPVPCCVDSNPTGYTVTYFSLDGESRWSVTISSKRVSNDGIQGMALGPDGVLYVAYHATGAKPVGFDTPYTLAAVATTGAKAGAVLGTWETDWQCSEMSPCGDVRWYQRETGVVVRGLGGAESLVAYVDQTGAPTSTTFVRGELASSTFDPISDPSGHVSAGTDDFGNTASSVRSTVRYGASTWTFDAFGVNIQEGTFASFEAQPDGAVVTSFEVCERAGCTGGRQQMVVGVLEAPDQVGLYAMNEAFANQLTAEVFVDRQLYGMQFADGTLSLVRFSIPR